MSFKIPEDNEFRPNPWEKWDLDRNTGRGGILETGAIDREIVHMQQSSTIDRGQREVLKEICNGENSTVKPETMEAKNRRKSSPSRNGQTNGQKNVRFEWEQTITLPDKKKEERRNFLQANDTSDLRLNVEGKALYVSRILLSVISPVLKDMLAKRPRDQSTLEIPLHGKKFDDVLEFLECVYPDTLKPVSDGNVELLLSMAAEYRVASLTVRCRDFLKSKLQQKPVSSTDLIGGLRLAIDFDLEDVRQLYYEAAQTIPSDVIRDTRGYDLLTTDVTLTLMTNRLSCFEETGRKICKRLKEAETHCGLYHKTERWGDNLCNKCLATVGKTAGFEIRKLFP